ncbi:unnamed protein product [Withania somnifera]
MAQNPKQRLLHNMTPPLLEENRQSFRHPPPPTTASPSKNCVPIFDTNSTSSSSAIDQLSKRVTRDLPNFSDCHGCGVRINHTDPNDRLQTLDSVWRIVLLCKKCIRRVNSGQTCPYCFKDMEDDSDCCKCSSCKRRVHKDCVRRYGNSAPWSFCSSEQGLESGIFVCIDCWLPSFFRKSIGLCRMNDKVVLKTQNCGSNSDFRSKDPNFGKRTVVLALKAKEKDKPLRKAVVEKNAKELAKSTLKLVIKKDKNKGLSKSSSVSSDDTNLTEAVNDAELAIQLHRAMNSSRRISKTLCPSNSSYVGGRENLESSNVSSKLLDLGQNPDAPEERLRVYSRTRYRGKDGRTSSETLPCVMVYSRTRLKEKAGQTSLETPPRVTVYSHTRFKERVDSHTRFKERVGKASSDSSPCVMTSSETPPCVTMNEHSSCVDSACSKAELVTYKRRRLKREMCKEKVGLSDLITEELNLGDDCGDLFGLQVSQREESQHNLHVQDASTLVPLSSRGGNTVQGEFCTSNTVQAESCNTQQDRFLLKYSRRKKCSKPGSDVHKDTFPQPTHDRRISTYWLVESRTSSNFDIEQA